MKFLPLKIPNNETIDAIERIKLFGIIAVILLHAIPRPWLNKIYAPYHIWQAVPVFMVLAGVTATLSEIRSGSQFVSFGYFLASFFRKARRILIPFTVIWIVQLLMNLLYYSRPIDRDWLFSWFRGGYGPGSYFTSVYIQHLAIFPFISFLDRQLQVVNLAMRMTVWLILALAIDYICLLILMPEWLYRLFYGRYILAVVIGMWLVRYRPSTSLGTICFAFGIAYLTVSSYFSWNPSFSYPAWIMQHAPVYFYSAGILLLLWYLPPVVCRLTDTLLVLGRASYHIFLVQMVYFWFGHKPLKIYFGINMSIPIALIICCSIGAIFYIAETNIQKKLYCREK